MSRQDFICCDRNSFLNWLGSENFVATYKHLSQLTCVVVLEFSITTKLSFVATKFIYWSFDFYVATEEILSCHNSFALYLDHCHDKIKVCHDSLLFILL